MSVKLFLSNGECYPISIHASINGEEFENDEDILEYILATYKTYPYYEVVAKMTSKISYIFTDKICYIETI